MRLLDASVSLLALTVAAPLFVLLWVVVKCSSPGPALYRASRIGKDGQRFTLYKFRTMVADAARRGPGVTGRDDPRVTSVGRWLRRTKLDELPQFFNVLRGDMSLVGPRPEDPRYVALYTPDQRKVLAVKPGLTSPATLKHRHEEELLMGPTWEDDYRARILPEKLEIDLDYLRRRTVADDMRVLAKTVVALVGGRRRAGANGDAPWQT